MKVQNHHIEEVVKKIKNISDAYYTVEAALLAPMLLFIIFFLMYAGIFQYDRCAIEQNTKQILLRASNEKIEESELYMQLLQECKLPFLTCISVDLKIGEKEAVINFLGGLQTILGSLGESFGFDFWLIESRHTTELYKPVKFIRNIRRVESYVANGFCE